LEVQTIFCQLNTVTTIDTKGTITLIEALKSNSSLTEFDSNKPVASFRSHLIQVTWILVIYSSYFPLSFLVVPWFSSNGKSNKFLAQNTQMWEEIHACISANALEQLNTLLSQTQNQLE
jgi:hypothetical protein